MYSPWGKVDNQKIVAEGVLSVSTPSHGGLKLDRKRNALIPEYMRRSGGWYEEDCEWAIPYVVLKLGDEKYQKAAEDTFRNWFADEYEKYYGRILQPGESSDKDRFIFEQENKNNLVVISAVGDWHENIPKGFVGVDATIGGVRGTPSRQFIIPENEYQARGKHGFVVDPNKYEEKSF